MSDKSDRDNQANQLDENIDDYWQSRDHDQRPAGWEECSQGSMRSPDTRR